MAGTLESKPGFFSVHDKFGEVIANEQAKAVLMNTVTAVAERALPEQMLLAGDPKPSLADSLNAGVFKMLLGDKTETALRRMHAALSKIPKA